MNANKQWKQLLLRTTYVQVCGIHTEKMGFTEHRSHYLLRSRTRRALIQAMSRTMRAVERAAAELGDDTLNDALGERWVPFVTTAHSRVPVALAALRIRDTDLFVDLGCGDGRMVLSAASECGARAVGIDISPTLIDCCHRAAAHAGLSCERGDRLRFLVADMAPLLFEAADGPKAIDSDAIEALSALNKATAIYVYALPMVVSKLVPFFLRAMARGARILTLDYHLPLAGEDLLSQLPPDCQPFVDYLKPREFHLFGKMRLYHSGGVLSTTTSQSPSPPTPASQAQQAQQAQQAPTVAVHSARTEAQRAALLAYSQPRRARLPNRLDPFDCTFVAATLRQAVCQMPCFSKSWWQGRSAAATSTTGSDTGTGGTVSRLVDVGDRRVCLHEAPGDYATRLWFSSLQLASWLIAHAEAFSNAAVLEVGAGTGLCSLALASASQTSRLIATDVSTRGLGLLRNSASAQDLTNVTCTPFDLCSDAPLPAEAEWLIASDVLYTPQLARALATRCVEIVRRGGRAIVADPCRPTRILFQRILEQEGFRGDFLPLETTGLEPGRALILLHVAGEHSVSDFVAHAELDG